MSFLDLLLLLIVAGVCGALGQTIAGYSHGGCLVAIVLGFIGALLGGALARWLQLPDIFTLMIGGRVFPVIWSVIGATLFVTLLNLLTARRRPIR